MVYHWQSYNVKRSGVDDMVLLSKISDEAIVDNLKKRYMDDYIFTCIGPVLVSINPFKQLGYFGEKEIELYQGAAAYENPPHIFGVSDEMFRSLLVDRENQCVIISGESGSGKTVAARYVMSFIARVSRGGTHVQHIKDVVLESNPLLEAFGNARTVRNNNSSRFGKYVEMQFGKGGQPTGGKISNFLLEKSRVVRHNDGERNFHIFYQLCKGASEQMRRDYILGNTQYYNYLNYGMANIDGIDDSSELQQTLKAMDVMGLTQLEKSDIFKLTSAVLHLGNINFSSDGQYTDITDSDDTLNYLSYLLSIDSMSLRGKLVSRKFDGKWGGKTEQVDLTLNIEQAIFTRDALAKALYARLFDFLVKTINAAMASKESQQLTIGILDIYGFEIFETNGFEQFCINYVNEKLQQIFIELTLKAEQEEYVTEQIAWQPIEYFNNQIVCDLLESRRPPGVFSLLDDVCATMHAGGAADLDLLKTLTKTLSVSEHFESLHRGFAIHHYAGRVVYTADGFCEKNRDVLFPDLVNLMRSSTSPFIRELFDEEIKAKSRPTTAGSKIRSQAKTLVDALTQCTPHYIRCIKPNETKRPRDWEEDRVKHQVEYLGLKENVRVRRAGFAYRRLYSKFLFRYGILTNETRRSGTNDPQAGVQIILNAMKVSPNQYQLGLTKLFIKAPETLFFLEEIRERRYNAYARIIQRAFKKFFFRKQFENNKRDAAILFEGKKQRRLASINRNFVGDYIGVDSRPKLQALIGRNEKVFFAEVVTKFDRNFKKSLRDLLLTNTHVYLIGRKKVRGGTRSKPMFEEIIKRKIYLDELSVTLSTFQDSYMVLHVKESFDTLLEVPLKTEFIYLLNTQFKKKFRRNIPLHFTDLIGFKVKKEGWGGGGTRQVQFQLGPAGSKESILLQKKLLKIFVPPGLPPHSRPKMVNSIKQVTNAATTITAYTNNNKKVPHAYGIIAAEKENVLNNNQAVSSNFRLPHLNPEHVKLRPTQGNINMANASFMKTPESGAAGLKRASLKDDVAKAAPIPKPRPPLKPKPVQLPKVKALYEYKAQDLDELSFVPGDIIGLIKEHDGGWWQGNFNGKEGLFPSNYVQKIS